jgi:hypothetical protein
MSPELETLDQLLGGDMTLGLVRAFFADGPSFVRAVTAMLQARDVRLLGSDREEVPRHQWAEVLAATGSSKEGQGAFKLSITEAGARRVG